MSLRKRRNAGLEVALVAGKRWSVDAKLIHLIAHSGNSVYRAQCRGKAAVLRLTDSRYRTRRETEAELQFIEHVDRHGVRVSQPLVSDNGLRIEEVSNGGYCFLASMFEYAPGVNVGVDSPHWSIAFVRKWGRSLGMLHRASRIAPALDRWHWTQEHLIKNAHHYLPTEDKESIVEFNHVMNWFGVVPETVESFGMTHSDYGPGNLHYSPSTGITVFDFGNCCYHWYVWDVAVGLRWLHALPDANHHSDALLAGYQEIAPLDPFLLDNLEWFIRLRNVYIYLDRLAELYQDPNNQAMKAEADVWREAVHKQMP